jgi:thioredoxin-like negative regulator of GroEL
MNPGDRGIEQLDQFDYQHRLEATCGPALVFFSGPHCGACRQLRRALTEYQASHGGILLFEVDAERDLALTRALNVFHLPSMFLYRDGEFHRQLHSQPLPDRLHQAIELALRLAPEEEP